MSYHERIARLMKATYMAGSLNSYDTILEALRKKFPREDDLRVYTEELARRLYADTGLVCSFEDGTIDCAHCSRVVLLDGEKGLTCGECGATYATRT